MTETDLRERVAQAIYDHDQDGDYAAACHRADAALSVIECGRDHGLTQDGWFHTADGSPCAYMNAAHSALLAKVRSA